MTSNASSTPIRIRQNASVKEKTLIRVVAETLKKLIHLYQVKNAEEILTSFDIQALRYKLKECLSRLMFLEPLEFGQKAEDTIWKSIFYQPIRIFKRELENQPNIVTSKSLMVVGFKRHILGAIGYYQKLIMRLEIEYGHVGASGIQCESLEMDDKEGTKEISSELRDWAFKCIQHCLLYIGDLYRYEHDIRTAHSRELATRYYRLVLRLNPSLGHAYNQMATLDTLSYYGLEAFYYYLKAQHCEFAFAQAKANLKILFERNAKKLRGVLDREAQAKKQGSGVSRGGLKVLRLKTCLIKYLNMWYSFSSASPDGIDNPEARHLAVMCDDVLSSFSHVLGFDRKLMPELSSSPAVRPSTLNCDTVSKVIFIAQASLKSLAGGDERLLDLAHTFAINLYGHVFNQCLVRVRDEIRAAGIDAAVLFRRQDPAEIQERESEEAEEELPRRRKVALSRRLVRARGDSHGQEDDLSEDDQQQGRTSGIWEDDLSAESSEEDDLEDQEGFRCSEDEDDQETEFETDEQIHSQDEDDQVIRAIVGQTTIFGRQQGQEKRGVRVPRPCQSTSGSFPTPRRTRRSCARLPAPSEATPDGTATPVALARCLLPVDLLGALPSVAAALLAPETASSLLRVWPAAPYLWKHLTVLLNFCEGLPEVESVPAVRSLTEVGLRLAGLSGGPLAVRGVAGARLWQCVAAASPRSMPRTNLVAASLQEPPQQCLQVAQAGQGSQAGPPADREKVMREMARLRLENELSSGSDGEEAHQAAPKVGRGAVYLVPDADTLCGRLEVLRGPLHSLQYVVVVPQAVIQRLDRRKAADHTARRAIKFLEAEMHRGGERLQIEAAIAPGRPALACDLLPDWPALEATAVRLARAASPQAREVVVTVLTEHPSALPASLRTHYAALGVDFQASIDL